MKCVECGERFWLLNVPEKWPDDYLCCSCFGATEKPRTLRVCEATRETTVVCHKAYVDLEMSGKPYGPAPMNNGCDDRKSGGE